MPVRKSTSRPKSKHTGTKELNDAFHTPTHLLSEKQGRIIFDAKRKGILRSDHDYVQAAIGAKYGHDA